MNYSSVCQENCKVAKKKKKKRPVASYLLWLIALWLIAWRIAFRSRDAHLGYPQQRATVVFVGVCQYYDIMALSGAHQNHVPRHLAWVFNRCRSYSGLSVVKSRYFATERICVTSRLTFPKRRSREFDGWNHPPKTAQSSTKSSGAKPGAVEARAISLSTFGSKGSWSPQDLSGAAQAALAAQTFASLLAF